MDPNRKTAQLGMPLPFVKHPTAYLSGHHVNTSRRILQQTALGRGGDCRGDRGGISSGVLLEEHTQRLSNGKHFLPKRVKEMPGRLTHQFLLDLLCTSIELHVILMSQKASRNEQNRGCLQCLMNS